MNTVYAACQERALALGVNRQRFMAGSSMCRKNHPTIVLPYSEPYRHHAHSLTCTLNAILNLLRLAIRYTLPRDSASISSSGVIVDSDRACTVPCSSSCSSCVADSEKNQVPSSAV